MNSAIAKIILILNTNAVRYNRTNTKNKNPYP